MATDFALKGTCFVDDHYSGGDVPLGMITTAELIARGYAHAIERKNTGQLIGRGWDVKYYQIQIHSDCPYPMANITDFDDVLTNRAKVVDGVTDNYYVWNQPLPAGWSPNVLMSHYNGVTLPYVPTGHYWSGDPLYDGAPHWFDGVDMSGIKDLTIVVNAPVVWNALAGGVLKSRTKASSALVPEKFTFKFLSEYSSILQNFFSRLGATKHVVLDCSEAPVRTGGSGENIYVRDISGFCEYNGDMETLEVRGKMLMADCGNVSNAFHNCGSLTEIPLFGGNDSDRTSWMNTWVMETLDQTFAGCESLTSIKPALDVKKITAINATGNAGAFGGCGRLSDIRLKNVNATWDFTNSKTYIPKMDVASINYLLDNVVAVADGGDRRTLTFANTYQSQVDAAKVSACTAKGYDIVWKQL